MHWLLEKGARITKVYGVIPAQRGRPFKEFVEFVSNERRNGDRDDCYAIIAESAKLVGNSAYGRTAMNKSKFKNVKFVNEKQFNRAKNSYFFYDADQHGESYEVSSNPRTVKQNIPIQVAFSVLDYAKLRMLEFYYDCIDKYLNQCDFQYMLMDTDSAYMGLTDDFDKLIKPELKEEFERDKNNWFPRTDTKEHRMFDKREPGLFKIEYDGKGMIALCSKTYYCFGDKNKCSCKGTQKQTNSDILNKETYKRCLMNKEQISCTNKGFRYIDNCMKTYQQEKIGLSSIYSKGIVFDDGIHIHPLII